jgi:hypothetical protein
MGDILLPQELIVAVQEVAPLVWRMDWIKVAYARWQVGVW